MLPQQHISGESLGARAAGMRGSKGVARPAEQAHASGLSADAQDIKRVRDGRVMRSRGASRIIWS